MTFGIVARPPTSGHRRCTVPPAPTELAAVRAGAMGYVAKGERYDRLLAAIRRIARGETSLPAEITRRLLEHTPRRPGAELLTASTADGLEARVEHFLARLRRLPIASVMHSASGRLRTCST